MKYLILILLPLQLLSKQDSIKILFEQGKYVEAAEKARSLESKGDRAIGLRILGNCFAQVSDFQRAENYYLESLEAVKSSKTLGNLGAIYFEQQELEKATIYFNRALEIAETKSEKASMHNNMGLVNLDLQEYEVAQIQFLKAKKLWSSVASNMEILASYNLGLTLYESNNPRESIYWYYLAKGQAENDSLANYLVDIYNNLNLAYADLGMHDSSRYFFELYVQTKESIAGNAVKLELTKKALELDIANQEADLERSEFQRTTFLLISLLLTISAFSGYWFLRYRSNRRLLSAASTMNQMAGEMLFPYAEEMYHDVNGGIAWATMESRIKPEDMAITTHEASVQLQDASRLVAPVDMDIIGLRLSLVNMVKSHNVRYKETHYVDLDVDEINDLEEYPMQKDIYEIAICYLSCLRRLRPEISQISVSEKGRKLELTPSVKDDKQDLFDSWVILKAKFIGGDVLIQKNKYLIQLK